MFLKNNHCCQEMLENKWLKWRPLAYAHSWQRGQVEWEGCRSKSSLHSLPWAWGLPEPPAITEGTGAMDTFLTSSQMQEYLCYTYEPLKWVAQFHHLHITSVLVSISQHSQEALLNISSWSQLQNAEQNMCKSGIQVTFSLTGVWLQNRIRHSQLKFE